MPESYREMEARHDALDDQMYRQELDGRWAGPNEYVEVAAPGRNENPSSLHLRGANEQHWPA